MSNPSSVQLPDEPSVTPEKEHKRSSLLRASALMASGTFVSRILGMVRALLLIAAIGKVAGVAGAFTVANQLPNMVANILAAGLFDAVLVPQITRALRRKDGEAYVNRLITLSSLILFGITVIALIAAPLLVFILASSYDAQVRTLAVTFSLLCLPQIFFYGLYNILGEVLNARRVFGPYMWAPVLNNVIAIAGLIAFVAIWGESGDTFTVDSFTSTQFWLLGSSATLGVVCQALCLIIPLHKAHIRIRPDFHFRGTSFRNVSSVAGWTFATMAIGQLSVISTSQIATSADTWVNNHPGIIIATTPAYTNAFMFFMLPQSIISLSLATVIFTRLSDAAARRDHRAVAQNYHTGVRLVTQISMLATILLVVDAYPLMQVLLLGNTSASVNSYALILVALSPGIVPLGIVTMTQRVFFAYEDARPVFMASIIPTIIQIAVGWTLYFITGARWWVFGAALAESLFRLFQCIISVGWVSRKNHHINAGKILALLVKYIVIAVVPLLIGVAMLYLLGPITIMNSRALALLVAIVKSMIVSIIVVAVYLLIVKTADPQSITGLKAVAVRIPGISRYIGEGQPPSLTTPTHDARGDNTGALPTGAVLANTSVNSVKEDVVPSTPAEIEKSQDASQVGLTIIGRTMAASDPSYTGGIPIVTRDESGEPVNPAHPQDEGGTSATFIGEVDTPHIVVDEVDAKDIAIVEPEKTSGADEVRADADMGGGEATHESLGDAAPPTDALHVSAADIPLHANDADEAVTSTPPTPPEPNEADTHADVEVASATAHAAEPREEAEAEELIDAPVGPDDVLEPEGVVDSAPEATTESASGGKEEPGDSSEDAPEGHPMAESASETSRARPSDMRPPQTKSTDPKAILATIRQRVSERQKADSELAKSKDLDTPDATSSRSDSFRESAAHSMVTSPDPLPDAQRPDKFWSSVPSRPIEPAGHVEMPWHNLHSTRTPAPVTATPSSTSAPRKSSDTRFNPAVPIVILFIVAMVVGLVFALHAIGKPIQEARGLINDLLPSSNATVSTSTPSDNDEGVVDQDILPPPTIQSISVLPWKDQQGWDFPEDAPNMIDGDPATTWRTLLYEVNSFTNDNAISIVIPFTEEASVSKVTLAMDPATKGGEVVLHALDNPDDPRQGTVLASTAMSGQTELKLDKPTSATGVVLVFKLLPFDSDNALRAVVQDITIQ